MTLSEERLQEMLGAWQTDSERARRGHGMNMHEEEIVSVLTELLSLRSDAHTSGEVNRYSPKLGRVDGYMFRTFNGMEPDPNGEWVKFADLSLGHPIQGEAVAWRELAMEASTALWHLHAAGGFVSEGGEPHTKEAVTELLDRLNAAQFASPQPPTPAGVREITEEIEAALKDARAALALLFAGEDTPQHRALMACDAAITAVSSPDWGTATDEQVEAAARALCRYGAPSFFSMAEALDWVDKHWRRFEHEARAALAAAKGAGE